MTQHWRGNPFEQDALGKFLRGRWQYGSVYVLDLDEMICTPKLICTPTKRKGRYHGILIEGKHPDAEDKSVTLTKWIAKELRWWSALFLCYTDDGTRHGVITRIDATFWSPTKSQQRTDVPELDFNDFDRWVCQNFGARLKIGAPPHWSIFEALVAEDIPFPSPEEIGEIR